MSISDKVVFIGCYDWLWDNPIQWLQNFKNVTGKGVAIVADFLSWESMPDVDRENNMVDSGYSIGYLCQIAPVHGYTPGGLQICRDIAAGVYDSYITTFAQALSRIHGLKLVGFGEEFNGYWNEFGSDPPVFVAAMRRFYTVIKSVDPTIQVGLYAVPAPNPSDRNSHWEGTNQITGEYQVNGAIDDYYPGDAYCDWWGVDIYSNRLYDYGDLITFEDWMTRSNYLNWHPTKPYIFGEFGAAVDWVNEQVNAQFWSQALTYMAQHKDRVRAFISYDAPDMFLTYPQIVSAYKAAIANSAFADNTYSVTPPPTKKYVFDPWEVDGVVHKENPLTLEVA